MADFELLNYLFGESGTAVDFFGGQWWFIGLFFLVLFAVIMFSEGADGRSISLMFLTGVVVMLSYGLFSSIFADSIFKTIIYFLLLFAGWYYYQWVKS